MRDLIWVARFPDGSALREIELLPNGQWRETPWDQVWRRRERLSWFGLEGASLSVGFRCSDGVFEINREPLGIWIEFDDRTRIRWTHQPVPYGRLLEHYKQAYSDARVPLHLADGKLWQERLRPVRTNLLGYWAGYRLKMTDAMGGQCAVQAGWWVPAQLGDAVEFRLTMSRSVPLRGRLVAEIGQTRREWPLDRGPGQPVSLKLLISQNLRLH